MRRVVLALLLLAHAGGCDKSSRRKPDLPVVVPVKDPPPTGGQHLVLRRHDPEAPKATLLPFQLEAGQLGEAVEIPASPIESWSGHFALTAATSGSQLAIGAGDHIDLYALAQGKLTATDSVPVELKPAAMHFGKH